MLEYVVYLRNGSLTYTMCCCPDFKRGTMLVLPAYHHVVTLELIAAAPLSNVVNTM